MNGQEHWQTKNYAAKMNSKEQGSCLVASRSRSISISSSHAPLDTTIISIQLADHVSPERTSLSAVLSLGLAQHLPSIAMVICHLQRRRPYLFRLGRRSSHRPLPPSQIHLQCLFFTGFNTDTRAYPSKRACNPSKWVRLEATALDGTWWRPSRKV